MIRSIAILTLWLAAFTAEAALLGRAPVTSGGTDYQAYYDDVLDITWLADANAGIGSIYVDSLNPPEWGQMSWASANAWIGSLNSFSYLGAMNWRLPKAIDTGTPGCNFSLSGTDCGYYTDPGASELATLFYYTLGNYGQYDTEGNFTDCVFDNGGSYSSYCLTNTGPFSNLFPAQGYWTGLGFTDGSGVAHVRMFDFASGFQSYTVQSSHGQVWAVHDGDPFAIVPIPPAVWLFASAFGVMGWMRRKTAEKRDV